MQFYTYATATLLAAAGALGSRTYAANWPSSQLFGRTWITEPETAPAGMQTVLLTYDDGPSPRNTPPLLDLLQQHGARATFFLIGAHAQRHAALARRIAEEGHTLGNHTAGHPRLARLNTEQTRQQLATAQQQIADATGVLPRLFRPPYGNRLPHTLQVAQELGLKPVMWNVTAFDWSQPEARVIRNVQAGLQRARRRGVMATVLLHDASHLDGNALADRTPALSATRGLLLQPQLRFQAVPTEPLAQGSPG